jgi:hypothetical protein
MKAITVEPNKPGTARGFAAMRGLSFGPIELRTHQKILSKGLGVLCTLDGSRSRQFTV